MRRGRVPIVAALLACAVLIEAAGCGPSGPETFPVTGKVVYKGRGNVSQLTGGRVRFQSVSDPSLVAVGEIEDTGAFSLGSFLKDKALPGVPAGQYKARVEPPVDDEEGKPLPVLHPRYLSFDKSGLTFTVPVEGEIVITVERPFR
jgi:hypothetical protein